MSQQTEITPAHLYREVQDRLLSPQAAAYTRALEELNKQYPVHYVYSLEKRKRVYRQV